jgi:hypothetical protein
MNHWTFFLSRKRSVKNATIDRWTDILQFSVELFTQGIKILSKYDGKNQIID